MNRIHEQNRACWDDSADEWRRRADRRGIWRNAHRDPTLVFCPTEMEYLAGVAGKDVCVLGSGDNEAVFALAGMGARVTSVDISERQLDVARERAGILGLSVRFLRADVTDLSDLADGSFDLAYTGGHVTVWVSDIRRFYAEAARILRAGGLLLINEYHPVRRMWQESEGPSPRYRYLDRGPYEYPTDAQNPHVETEFHWTVADHIQAVLDGGCALVRVEELGEGAETEDYAANVPAALPMSLVIVGRKTAA